MSKAVFITGTGTDMGKTYLSGLIVKKLAQAGKSLYKRSEADRLYIFLVVYDSWI